MIGFIKTGKRKLDSYNLFDIQSLATYLQIKSLQKACFNYFTYHLNVRTVYDQLELLESYPLLDKIYKKNAMVLIKRDLWSFSGLYFVKARNHGGNTNLKMFCEYTKSVHNVTCLDKVIYNAFDETWLDINDLTIQRIRNALIIFVVSNHINCCLQYDVISGKLSQILPICECPTLFCTSDKSLFVIRQVEDETKKTPFSLSLYNEKGVFFVWKNWCRKV